MRHLTWSYHHFTLACIGFRPYSNRQQTLCLRRFLNDAVAAIQGENKITEKVQQVLVPLRGKISSGHQEKGDDVTTSKKTSCSWQLLPGRRLKYLVLYFVATVRLLKDFCWFPAACYPPQTVVRVIWRREEAEVEEAAGWRKLLPGRRRFKNVQAEVNFVSISRTADFSAAPFSSKTLKLELNNVQVKAWPRGLPAGGVGGGRMFGSRGL